MEKYSKAEMEAIVKKFNNKTLPKSKWTHDAHIIIAFWHHSNYDFENALSLVKSKIKAYNETVGTANTSDAGYHETLTIFWMIVTRNFLSKHSANELIDVINQFFESNFHKNTPLEFYDKALLFSFKARKRWINGNLKQIELERDLATSHYAYSKTEFKTAFANCTLNPSLFSHEAHLRLAWMIVQENGIERAIEIICNQIQHYVKHLGALDKFNKTLTIAATQAVHHFIQKSNAKNFSDFILEFPRLKNNFKGLMATHYSFDIYNSSKAKAKYLAPDLSPF